jgi:hypothetical protein
MCYYGNDPQQREACVKPGCDRPRATGYTCADERHQEWFRRTAGRWQANLDHHAHTTSAT